MATIIAKVAGIIGKNVLSSNLWRREPTPEPTPWQKVAGFSQKAAGYKQKAAGFARNPPPFLLIHVSLHILDNLNQRRHVLNVNLRVAVNISSCLIGQRAVAKTLHPGCRYLQNKQNYFLDFYAGKSPPQYCWPYQNCSKCRLSEHHTRLPLSVVTG